MLDSREPPRGDFVAYVEKIEREQLVRAMQPHKLPHMSASGTVVTDESPRDETHRLSAAEAQRVLRMLKTPGKDGASPPRGAIIGAALGVALIAFGLLAEGGFVLVILGAVLLWHNLRKLRRVPVAAVESAGQQVDRSFGRKSASTARGRNA